MRNTQVKRLMAMCDVAIAKNTHPRCRSRVEKSYFHSDEREYVRRFYERYGIKYTVERRRLRLAYKIPWGVDFDLANPGSCPQAGKWNGALEIFCEVWKDSTREEKREFIEGAWPSPPPDPRRN